MGNCSLRAVTDAAEGLDSGRITTHSKDIFGREQRAEAAVGSALNSFMRTDGKMSVVEVLPRPENGVWKVKLVIDPKDLEQILSEEVNTEALIEQMRIAANSTPKRGKSSSGSHLSQMCSFK